GPYVFDISTALRPGKNEIRVRVANLINNSYGDRQESGLFGPVVLRTPQTSVSNDMVDVNFAAAAKVKASSTSAGYSPKRANDSDSGTALGGESSWSNADGTGLPQWVELDFGSDRKLNAVEIYTTDSYELKDFQIEYWNGKEWLPAAGRITDNTAAHRSIRFPTVTASKLRLMGYRGPDKQPNFVRVNEIEAYYRP
ncbi:MAG: discoidin domain-containing protein, partial [Verrucomicrobiota bacterium]